jgi:hypothetical protein
MKRSLAILAVLLLAGCGGKSSPTEPNPAESVYLTVYCIAESAGGLTGGVDVKLVGTGFNVSAMSDATGAAILPAFPANAGGTLTAWRSSAGTWTGSVGPFSAGPHTMYVWLK